MIFSGFLVLAGGRGEEGCEGKRERERERRRGGRELGGLVG